jgi:hypothetical protein
VFNSTSDSIVTPIFGKETFRLRIVSLPFP